MQVLKSREIERKLRNEDIWLELKRRGVLRDSRRTGQILLDNGKHILGLYVFNRGQGKASEALLLKALHDSVLPASNRGHWNRRLEKYFYSGGNPVQARLFFRRLLTGLNRIESYVKERTYIEATEESERARHGLVQTLQWYRGRVEFAQGALSEFKPVKRTRI